MKLLKQLWQTWRAYRAWEKEWEIRYKAVLRASYGTTEEFQAAIDHWNSLPKP